MIGRRGTRLYPSSRPIPPVGVASGLQGVTCDGRRFLRGATTSSPPVEFLPVLQQQQLADVQALHDDAASRGWHPEIVRHAGVIASLQGHIHRLKPTGDPQAPA